MFLTPRPLTENGAGCFHLAPFVVKSSVFVLVIQILFVILQANHFFNVFLKTRAIMKNYFY